MSANCNGCPEREDDNCPCWVEDGYCKGPERKKCDEFRHCDGCIDCPEEILCPDGESHSGGTNRFGYRNSI